MAPRKPTTLAPGLPVPPTHILAPSSQLSKYLLRLSKESLVKLVTRWLTNESHPPELTATKDDEDDDEYDDKLLEDVEDEYPLIKSKAAVVDRILTREWRGGLSMMQIAQVDVQYLLDHPTSHKWTAGELVPQGNPQNDMSTIPKFRPQTFTRALNSIISPMVACHYHTIQHPTLPITLLRLSLHDRHPLPTTLPPSNQIIFFALPKSSPHIFFTPQNSELVKIVHKSLPTALSSEHRRYEVEPVSLSAQSLETLCAMKGSGRGATAAGGGWSVYTTEGEGAVDCTPLEGVAGKRRLEEREREKNMDGEGDTEMGGMIGMEPGAKKQQRIAAGRFGNSGLEGDLKALARGEYHLREAFPRLPRKEAAVDKTRGKVPHPAEGEDDGYEEDIERPYTSKDWRPAVTLVLEGTHIFAGVRTLVEQGMIDGTKMPAFMTGEDGKSVGIVKDGKIIESRRP